MKSDLLKEITATYEKHGWKLKKVLLSPNSKTELENLTGVLREAPVEDASFDALWFSRPSTPGTEAWELRLMAETPYALFEKVESDATEHKKEAILRGMEARLRHYVKAT